MLEKKSQEKDKAIFAIGGKALKINQYHRRVKKKTKGPHNTLKKDGSPNFKATNLLNT